MLQGLRILERAAVVAGALIGLAALGGVQAQGLSGPALVKALQQGGYVVAMRHASSPQTPPARGEADPGNPALERQLDEAGRASARAMGAALRRLRIPIGEVWSSPTYRARLTVQLMGLPAPKTEARLGDGGQSMQAASADQSAWLKAKAAQAPGAGTDTLIVTHYPNLTAAFGQAAAGMTDGEALVFHPVGGALEPIGRIRIEDWPALAN